MKNPVRSIILAGAAYDLIVALPLAIPPLARPDLNLLFSIGDMVGLTGTVPQFDQVHLLFINLFGVFVTAWGIFKLRSSNLQLVSLDLIMRVAVLALLLWHVLAYNSHPIVYLFIVADIVWTGLDYWGHRRVSAT